MKILLFQLSLKPCPSYIAEILLKYLVLGFRISNGIELQIEFLVKGICQDRDLESFIFLNNKGDLCQQGPMSEDLPGPFQQEGFQGSVIFLYLGQKRYEVEAQ